MIESPRTPPELRSPQSTRLLLLLLSAGLVCWLLHSVYVLLVALSLKGPYRLECTASPQQQTVLSYSRFWVYFEISGRVDVVSVLLSGRPKLEQLGFDEILASADGDVVVHSIKAPRSGPYTQLEPGRWSMGEFVLQSNHGELHLGLELAEPLSSCQLAFPSGEVDVLRGRLLSL